MNLASTNYEEKRNYIRMKVDTIVSVKNEADRQLNGICHNLSGGGMLVALKETLALGDTLEITVQSTHSHSPMLKALARVRRIKEKNTSTYLHGLEIEELLN